MSFVHTLGPLEEEVMDIIWRNGPLSVREVNRRLNGRELAYTTVMTTLDRLYKKGLLKREKDGLAYQYGATQSRAQFEEQYVNATVTQLMAAQRRTSSVLAAFVDVAAQLDEKNLTMLEVLIARKRKEGH